jgi:putative acetyltransferase
MEDRAMQAPGVGASVDTDGSLRIRAERPDDRQASRAVHRLAFGRENEADLVDAIRASDSFIPELSLVAERSAGNADASVVGHILLSRIVIRGEQRDLPALALAPVAVRPEKQNRGIGAALIVAGLEQARRLGERIVVLIGHPSYYPRFGFAPARSQGIEPPFPVADAVFMALALAPNALDGVHGTVVYPPAFGSV